VRGAVRRVSCEKVFVGAVHGMDEGGGGKERSGRAPSGARGSIGEEGGKMRERERKRERERD